MGEATDQIGQKAYGNTGNISCQRGGQNGANGIQKQGKGKSFAQGRAYEIDGDA